MPPDAQAVDSRTIGHGHASGNAATLRTSAGVVVATGEVGVPPDAHAVVHDDGLHRVVARLVPLLLTQLQNLLQALPQVRVLVGDDRQTAERAHLRL